MVLSGGNDRLPTGTIVTLGISSLSAVLQLGDSGGAVNQTIAGLIIDGGTANAIVGGNAATSKLTVNTSQASSFSGTLGGAGTNQNNLALAKSGTFMLTLSGANTYTGTTTVSQGTLALSGSGSFANSPTISVASGATLSVSGVTGGSNFGGTHFALASGQTLSGTGAVSGAMDVPSGATVSPGSSGTGTLTVGSTAFQSGGTLAAALGSAGTSTALAVGANTLNFLTGSVLSLSGLDDTTPRTYTLATLTSGANLQANGTTVPDGGTLGTLTVGQSPSGTVTIETSGFASGDSFSLKRSGNNLMLVFTPVPEPGCVTAIVAAGLGGAAWLRRRRRSAAVADAP